jgi:APA family basic amino acid/polyamine antiporter
MVVVGSIIGSGIFKKIAPMALKLQSEPLVLTSWALAGLVTLFGALTYAEIAGRLAQTGGLYAYLRTMFGRPVGYLFGWACFAVIQSASIASIAFVFSEALLRLFSANPSEISTKIVAIAAIGILTFINGLGLFFGAWLENIFSVLKIVGISVVTILGFSVAARGSPSVGSLPVPEIPHGMALIPAMFSTLISAFWAFDGLNNIGFIGGEVRNPHKTIPRALILGVLGIVGIYLAVNIAYFHALPLGEILVMARDPEKIFAVEMLQRVYGSSWALFATVLIMISTFGATNGSILTSARIYFAMARDGLFFRRVGVVHTSTHVPVAALLIQGIWSSALVFMGTFDELTDMLIFASFIFYGLGALGLLRLRSRQRNYDGFTVMTWIPCLYILFCLALVIVTVYQDPGGSLEGLVLIGSGLPFYIWFSYRTGQRANSE